MSSGLLSRADLDGATGHAQRAGLTLADAIVSLGLTSETDCYDHLATATTLPLVDLEATTPAPLALRLVPERVARRHLVLPLQEDNRTLKYATADPFDDEAERDVAFASGRWAQPVLARRSQLLAALDRHYLRMDEIEQLIGRVRSEAAVETVGAPAAADESQSPVIRLCNHLLASAVTRRASDVHIEPLTNGGAVVRLRINGILTPILTLPPGTHQPVLNRFKVLARVDIAVRQRAQDGAFRVRVAERPVDVRLSTLPTLSGEKLVMRVIDSTTGVTPLDALGYDAAALDAFRRVLNRPDGLILVTGPTGSGKTTTLYAALHHLRSGRTNIVSVEDPVERRLDGVNQIPVNARAGTTFATVLRSVLRQDPNVIMVGEIRDPEVADIVGQAAYTGHLVLSSLHTGDVASALTRLFNLGLPPFKIAESLSAIIAQRLLRRLCPDCQAGAGNTRGRTAGDVPVIGTVGAAAEPLCGRCQGIGYLDRVVVAEVLVPDEEMRATIARGATAREIRAAMRAAGCRTMREVALELVAQGVTSQEEVDRVLAHEDSAPAAVPDTARRDARAPMAGPASPHRRIVVADDDPMIRMLVRLLLEREGHEVFDAHNGLEGIDLVRQHHPDLLIVDLTMPEVDGYRAIEEVRRQPELAGLAIMVLTAAAESAVETRVLELGADDYLVKPFEAAVLLSRVRAMFRRLERAA